MERWVIVGTASTDTGNWTYVFSPIFDGEVEDFLFSSGCRILESDYDAGVDPKII